MDLNKTSSATSQVRSAVREIAQSQGGTEPAGKGNLGAGKHTSGVAKGMTGRDGPEESAMGYDYGFGGRDFGPEDNVSCDCGDDYWG